MVRAIEANGIKPMIGRSFPLEALAEALRHLKVGQHFGKACIDV
jgi:NADPH:quinone reductase-like Zn-dependent oxidoreductase